MIVSTNKKGVETNAESYFSELVSIQRRKYLLVTLSRARKQKFCVGVDVHPVLSPKSAKRFLEAFRDALFYSID